MNFKQLSLLSATLLFPLLFSGCKKEQKPEPKPIEETATYHVVNSGSIFDDNLKKYKAASWLNKEFYPLESVASEETGAYGIGIEKANIYVAGYYVEDDRMHPCYWYNGKQRKLQLSNGNYWRATALDALIFNGKLHILGSVDLVPTIWIVDVDKIVSMIVLKTSPNTVEEELRSSNRFFLRQNKLYLGAAQVLDKQNGNFSYEVGYWTINNQASVTYNALATNLQFARVYSIAAYQNQVAMSGETINAGGQNVPIVWGSKGAFNIADKIDPNTQRIGGITADPDGNVYAMVSSALFSPQLAKMSMNNLNTFSSFKPLIPQEAKGNIKAVDYNEQYAYSCVYALQNRYFATYWLDQKPFELEIAEKHYTYVNLTGIKVVNTKGARMSPSTGV